MRFAIIASRFNQFIVDQLVKGAQNVLEGQVTHDIIWVPGALEIPIVAQKAAKSGQYQALVCLGAVIKGTTHHYEHVSREVHQGITRVSLDCGLPVTMGVLTVETMAQAIERAGGTCGNVGANAALAALDVAKTIEKLGAKS
ncbi:MAG: 6,7-dimethyl-8-ribityllumazine synthase [Myxococcota bacterium]